MQSISNAVQEQIQCIIDKGDPGLFYMGSSKKFTVSTDSFMLLCTWLYKRICSNTMEFKDVVSESMFMYYNVILLWRRIAEIRFHSEMATQEEINFIKYLHSKKCVCTLGPISTYLECIGDFEDVSGMKYKFTLPCLPKPDLVEGVTGYFGKVNSETHTIYEAFPSPGVCAQRMIEDYNFTKKLLENNTSIWDLPKALRPDYETGKSFELVEHDVNKIQNSSEFLEENSFSSRPLPTANLLGWAQAVSLTNKQFELIKSVIEEDIFKIDYFKMFCFNETIFEYISREIYHIIMSQCKIYTMYFNGSLSQALFLENCSKETIFDRHCYYCKNTIRAVSAHKYNTEVSVMARIFGYRIKKEDVSGLSSWSCYDFNEYKNVPESWKLSRNTIFNFGNVELLNNEHYYTIYSNRNDTKVWYIFDNM